MPDAYKTGYENAQADVKQGRLLRINRMLSKFADDHAFPRQYILGYRAAIAEDARAAYGYSEDLCKY